jgi:arginyl-tRNA synthetase
MVDLPSGKMKSREGKVVDADDLVDEMVETAKKMSAELGKLDNYTNIEQNNIIKTIGLGALKYFILKVDPKKNMTFNPEESVDFNGNTGPFIQYTFARIQSLKAKAAEKDISIPENVPSITLNNAERELIKKMYQYPDSVQEAGKAMNPGIIANYTYDLVKQYNQFYQEHPVLKNEDETVIHFRLMISHLIGRIIQSSMKLLGIEVPPRM